MQQVANANRELRTQKVALATTIIARETETFRRGVAAHNAAPTIIELRTHLDRIRAAELEKCLRKLGPMTPAQHDAIEQLTLQLVNKILHHPIARLKEQESLQQTIRAMFGLT